MSALGQASLGTQCEDKALGMATIGTICAEGLPPIVEPPRRLKGSALGRKRRLLEQQIRDDEDMLEFVVHVVLSGMLDE